MHVEIDFTPIQEFFMLPPDVMLWRFLAYFGWIIFAIMFLWFSSRVWLSYIRQKWGSQTKFIFLAIDIPRGNIQSPQAVENLFSYLGGAHSVQNFWDKWFVGEYQLSFSFEIVSLEGYTQFIIRTPSQFRSLVESAIYSQYPDAEIVEVDDYCEGFPRKFPDQEYDIWGAEFKLSSHYMYPIKTYRDFEHKLGPEEITFKDPMAELMELYSSLRKGENIWFQIIVIPTGFDWIDDGKGEIDKILGKKADVSLANKIVDSIMKVIDYISEAVYTLWGDVEDKESEFKKLSMMELTPRQKKKIEGLDRKASKLGFLCKLRMVYIARKEVMNKPKASGGFVGFIKQFTDLDLNGFKPDMKGTGTKANYFNKTARVIRKKNNLINNYMDRSDFAGVTPYILNIEELATLWHFPVESVSNAPLVQKTAVKRHKPPANLAVDDAVSTLDSLKDDLMSQDYSRIKK